MRYLPLIFLLTACGWATKHPAKDGTPNAQTESLANRREIMLEALKVASDHDTGWPSVSDCDGTLWAGEATAVGSPVNLGLAEYPQGVLNRRPPPTCYPAESASSVSRDMFIGYLWGIWVKKDLAAAQRIADYGGNHNWVMGVPTDRPYEVDLGDNDTGLLCRIVEKLSNGADTRSCADKHATFFPVVADYEHHIQVIDILLQDEVKTSAFIAIDGFTLDRLKEAVASNPNDALFQAALAVYTGDYSKATELLLSNDYQYPSYVRGADSYKQVHWLFAASIVLKHQKG